MREKEAPLGLAKTELLHKPAGVGAPLPSPSRSLGSSSPPLPSRQTPAGGLEGKGSGYPGLCWGGGGAFQPWDCYRVLVRAGLLGLGREWVPRQGVGRSPVLIYLQLCGSGSVQAHSTFDSPALVTPILPPPRSLGPQPTVLLASWVLVCGLANLEPRPRILETQRT